MLFSLIIDIISREYGAIVSNNLVLLYFLSLAEIIAFSLLYYTMMENKKIPIYLGGIGVGYVLLELLYLEVDSVALFQSYSKVVGAFIIVIMAMYHIFIQISRGKEIENKGLIFGILFYFSMEFILMLPLNYLINYTSEIVVVLWLFRVSVISIFYLILIHFIWSSGRSQKPLRFG